MPIPKTIEGRELNKFVDSPTRENGTAVEVKVSNKVDLYQGSIIAGIEYDAVLFSYPDNVTEVHRYYLGGVDGILVATVTAVFDHHSKKNLISLVRT
jgi:hypothetical protein